MIAAVSARGRRLALTAALAAASPACGEAPVTRRAPAPPLSVAVARPATQAHADAAQAHADAAQAHADAAQGGSAEAQTRPAETRALPTACTDDAGCGYDPATERCGADPRLNRQPPLTDQGVVCYCDAGACALLRVLPVPCEGDSDCAVAHEPRPHPVRATRERPHEKGRPCRDLTLSTTCERTNICTLRRHTCPKR
ncbi:hypothetical protein [Sorangium sp. So ce1097]|uniref:hypothetical protein n=1 Tax=Sorangium sp. So ce1097 TaxID=3133330 RepID=UPI003F628AAB